MYSIVYRSLSPIVHGDDFQQSFLPSDARDANKLVLPTEYALHKTTHYIVDVFLARREMTSATEIEFRLGLGPIPKPFP